MAPGPGHVPREPKSWRYQIVQLDEAAADCGLVVEGIHAHAHVQQEVRRDVPVVLEVPGGGGGLEHPTIRAATPHHVGTRTGRHDPAIAHHGSRRAPVHRPHQARTRITGPAIGGHHLMVQAEAQQVIAEGPLEIEPAHLAFVLVIDDGTVGMAGHAWPAHPRINRVVTGIDRHEITTLIGHRRAGVTGTAIDAVHRLGHEILTKLADVGQGSAFAATFVCAAAGQAGGVAGRCVESIDAGVTVALIGERGREAEPLPVLMDDILVNFDPERAKAAASAVLSLAGNHQILFFTCHPHTADLLESLAREKDRPAGRFVIKDGRLQG